MAERCQRCATTRLRLPGRRSRGGPARTAEWRMTRGLERRVPARVLRKFRRPRGRVGVFMVSDWIESGRRSDPSTRSLGGSGRDPSAKRGSGKSSRVTLSRYWAARDPPGRGGASCRIIERPGGRRDKRDGPAQAADRDRRFAGSECVATECPGGKSEGSPSPDQAGLKEPGNVRAEYA